MTALTLPPERLAQLDAIIAGRRAAKLSAIERAELAIRELGLREFLGRDALVSRTAALGRLAQAGANRDQLLSLNAALHDEWNATTAAALETLVVLRTAELVEPAALREAAE